MKPTSGAWLEIAEEDLDAAEAMLTTGRYLYAGFEAQQAAEKAMKAVIQEAMRVPPKVHNGNLVVLADRAGLCDVALVHRLAVLSSYYGATRYPEDREVIGQRTTADVARALINTAREVLAWARVQLTSQES